MPKKPINPDEELEDSWAEDQKDRGYYYDDAHGYEEYHPEADEDVDSESESNAGGVPPVESD